MPSPQEPIARLKSSDEAALPFGKTLHVLERFPGMVCIIEGSVHSLLYHQKKSDVQTQSNLIFQWLIQDDNLTREYDKDKEFNFIRRAKGRPGIAQTQACPARQAAPGG